MAEVGQIPTQAPHPVQASISTSIRPTGRARRSKRKARSSQTSVQVRHETPLFKRHPAPRVATSAQGSSVLSKKTVSSHASAQAPQKVQAPAPKSSFGVPAGPSNRMAPGQTAMQALQEVQCSRMRASVVQGGRWTSPRQRPLGETGGAAARRRSMFTLGPAKSTGIASRKNLTLTKSYRRRTLSVPPFCGKLGMTDAVFLDLGQGTGQPNTREQVPGVIPKYEPEV